MTPDAPINAAVQPSAAGRSPSPGAIALGIVLGIGALALIALFARPLALLFLAVCTAAAFAPLITRLSGRVPRNTAILLVYLALLVIVVILIALLLTPLVRQFIALADRLPELIDRLRLFLDENNISEAQIESLTTQAGQFGAGILRAPISVVSGALDIVLVLIVSLYLLMDAPQIRRFVLSLVGANAQGRVDAIGLEMVGVAGGYLRGVSINIALVSVITTLGLGVIGLPFALVLGITAGLFEALPVVGSLIAVVPIMVVALLQSPTTALITFVFIIVVQQVQGNVITPAVMRDQVHLPRFLVPLAVVAGAGVGGILGALIAVPLIAVLRVFVLRVVAPIIRRFTGAPTPTEDAI